LRRRSNLGVLLLSCGLLWSFVAWGLPWNVSQGPQPIYFPDTYGNARAGSLQLEWARPNDAEGPEPRFNEVFHIHLIMMNHVHSSNKLALSGKIELELPAGLELAKNSETECWGRDYDDNENTWVYENENGRPVCSVHPLGTAFQNKEKKDVIPVHFDRAPWAGRMPKNFAAMVRVPVIARKPLVDAPLKAVFTGEWKGAEGQPIQGAHTIHTFLSVRGVEWDLFQVHEIGHEEAKIRFTLYNWRKNGKLSISVVDEHGNHPSDGHGKPYNDYEFPGDLRQIVGDKYRIQDILFVGEVFVFPRLQPETHYRLQARFTPFSDDGRLIVVDRVDSEWFHFRTTALPQFEVTLPPANPTQGRVDISPEAKAYPLGTEVTLTAHPASGWELEAWFVNNERRAPENPLRLTVDKNLNVVPSFIVERNRTGGNNPDTSSSGGCSQGPQKPSWGSLVLLGMLALGFLRKPRSA